LVHIFVKKYQVGPRVFFYLNLVTNIEKMMQFDFFSSNFLNQIKIFSSKLKMVYFLV